MKEEGSDSVFRESLMFRSLQSNFLGGDFTIHGTIVGAVSPKTWFCNMTSSPQFLQSSCLSSVKSLVCLVSQAERTSLGEVRLWQWQLIREMLSIEWKRLGGFLWEGFLGFYEGGISEFFLEKVSSASPHPPSLFSRVSCWPKICASPFTSFCY